MVTLRSTACRRLTPMVACLVMVAGAAAGGCAVHNPTDLAQRRPATPAATSGTVPAGSATSFDSHGAVRLLAKLGYGKARPRQIPPGPLRAFVASCRNATTTPCLNIFFFYGDKYAGAAFARPQSKLSIKKQDGRIVRTAVPGPKGGFRNVRYIWTGQEVIGLANTGTVPLVRVPAH
ncbi:MAG TPA: hypothetical protein VH912_27180 [Streptosporangiaceae bacterium]